MSTFDAKLLARGWLSVAIASSTDNNRPALDRTILIESFPRGVRLVATDGYVPLTSWVAALADELEPEPSLDESPVAVAVARDPYGRAMGFFGHLHKLATEDNAPLYEVRVQFGVRDTDPATSTGTLDGMESTYVIVDYPDHERLKLETYEGHYPMWRKLVGDFTGKRTDAVALAPDMIGRLAKLGKLHGGAPLIWRWGGAGKAARIEVRSDPFVAGVVMPARADLGGDQ